MILEMDPNIFSKCWNVKDNSCNKSGNVLKIQTGKPLSSIKTFWIIVKYSKLNQDHELFTLIYLFHFPESTYKRKLCVLLQGELSLKMGGAFDSLK